MVLFPMTLSDPKLPQSTPFSTFYLEDGLFRIAAKSWINTKLCIAFHIFAFGR